MERRTPLTKQLSIDHRYGSGWFQFTWIQNMNEENGRSCWFLFSKLTQTCVIKVFTCLLLSQWSDVMNPLWLVSGLQEMFWALCLITVCNKQAPFLVSNLPVQNATLFCIYYRGTLNPSFTKLAWPIYPQFDGCPACFRWETVFFLSEKSPTFSHWEVLFTRH